MTDNQAKIHIYKPFDSLDAIPEDVCHFVFLSGYTGNDWRGSFIEQFKKSNELPTAIANPLRTDWDNTWTERRSNPQFHDQVEWELDAQAHADVVAVYLHPGAPSPTTLLELGLAIRGRRAVVCCPDGFEWKGHVERVCKRHNIPLVDTFDDFVPSVIRRLRDPKHVRGTASSAPHLSQYNN